MDPASIVTVISAISSSIDLFDKIADQIAGYLSKGKETRGKRPYGFKVERDGDTLVAKVDDDVFQTITADDLRNLPDDQLKYVQALERSMENNFLLWTSIYPDLPLIDSPVQKAKVEAQLRDILKKIKDDLDGIIEFLKSIGLHLDDHYMHIRDLLHRHLD